MHRPCPPQQDRCRSRDSIGPTPVVHDENQSDRGNMRRLMSLLSAVFLGILAAQVPSGFIGEPSGTGPFPAAAESRSELPGHTVYRPVDWPRDPLPLFVWGNGGRSNNGLAHAALSRGGSPRAAAPARRAHAGNTRLARRPLNRNPCSGPLSHRGKAPERVRK